MITFFQILGPLVIIPKNQIQLKAPHIEGKVTILADARSKY